MSGYFEVLKGGVNLEEERVVGEWGGTDGGLALLSGMRRGDVWRIDEGGRGTCLFLIRKGVGDEGRTGKVTGRVVEGGKWDWTGE